MNTPVKVIATELIKIEGVCVSRRAVLEKVKMQRLQRH